MKASKTYNLRVVNPGLAVQWHPVKNRDLKPGDVTPCSNKKVWWVCEKDHEWQAEVVNRTNGNGCPYCSGQRVSKDNCLKTKNPSLARQWHPLKNGDLTPEDVTPGSGKKVWWVCEKGHEWQAVVASRTNGYGCPYCSGRIASRDNCLQTRNPSLAREWHPVKNGNLKPKDVTPGSGKKVWWVCEKGHEWQVVVASRTNGYGCPYCSGKRVNKDNCLKTKNPSLARQWHPVKNGHLKPADVTAGSSKKVWWLCTRGHEWQAVVDSRTKGNGCPYCSGRIASRDHCLKTDNPLLAGQWHPFKNEHLKPENVTPGSNKSVWWICSKGHEWQALVKNRNKLSIGCPYCSGKIASRDNCLQTRNPSLAREWHPVKNDNLKPKDVTSGSSKKVWWLCIKDHEWQESVVQRNSRSFYCPYCAGKRVTKDNCLKTKNPSLARQWHPVKNRDLKPEDVTPGSNKKVWWVCEKDHEWQAKVVKRTNGNGCPYCAGQRVNKDNCLKTKNPSLARQWHPVKNGSLKPEDVTAGSGRKVWWVCTKGHEWQAIVGNRNKKGYGCPYCSGKGIRKHTSLKIENPSLAR